MPLFQWAQVGRTNSLLAVWDLSVVTSGLKDYRESGAMGWLSVKTDLD